MLRLMTDAGLRRSEVTKLKVRNVGTRALRLRGKEDRDRTIPLTRELALALEPYCEGKSPDDPVLGVTEGVVYHTVKRHGRLVGKPELKPHDLRHSFATRLLENGVNIRYVQELLGHSIVATTQVYEQVAGNHLEDAINTLNKENNGKKHKWSVPTRKTDPNASKWVQELYKLAGKGKNYIINRDGRLEEVP